MRIFGGEDRRQSVPGSVVTAPGEGHRSDGGTSDGGTGASKPGASKPIETVEGWKRGALLAVISFVFLGCEAELKLDQIDAENAKVVRRYDQFLAAARSDQGIVVAGAHGVILSSTDDGQSWRRTVLGDASAAERPALIGTAACAGGAFVVLDYSRRIWLASGPEGPWEARELPIEDIPLAITCGPSDRLWVVGEFSMILFSDDLGESWNDRSVGDDFMFTTVQFVNDAFGVITGEFGRVYVTADGGDSWTESDPLPDEFYSQAALFTTPEEGWVGGLQGVILHTENGGRTWNREETEADVPIYGLVSDGDRLYAVGDHATLLRRVAERWVVHKDEAYLFGYLRAVLPLSGQRMLVAGGAGNLAVIDLPDAAHAQAGKSIGLGK